uniref:Uncharacterized protein n=1 Tax=Chenopodium quinoa TaxID=63459 RepID=A0A803MRW3_CHEQI
MLHQAVIEEGKLLSDDQKDNLCRAFSVEDLKLALWSIDDDKAPSPDGFSSKFFKASWDMVKDDLCKAVLSFFDHGCLLKQVNATLLTMVPKAEGGVA